ncbi:hypothetical protein GHK86_09020 [Acidimicrobiaceae bacterium USS-CC1]|uniref:Uncharacterized protein n=1 Tax=Acidiferrimicrobium australe TaxID=2664430 RepID=A0ABW9QWX1_9ACTN|nr:hypothetical protein [Acidiferrimicrobium australe]
MVDRRGLDDDQLDAIAEQGWHAVQDNPPESHVNILGHLILSLVDEMKARRDSGGTFPLQLAVELDGAGDYAFAIGARAALGEHGFLPPQLVDSALRRLERRAGSWLERNATAEEVSAHEGQLRTLSAEMGLSGFETRDDGLVGVHTDEAGYRSVARFATEASRLVGAWVQVVTDDSDAGGPTKVG